MNFRAEAKSESTILLTWSPPRQEIIVKYELLYRDEHGTEVSTPDRLGGALGWKMYLQFLLGKVQVWTKHCRQMWQSCLFTYLLYFFLFFLVNHPHPQLQFSRTFDPVTAFIVKDLKPNTEYVFQLAARSALGLGAHTPEVRERTLQSSRCLSFPRIIWRDHSQGAEAEVGCWGMESQWGVAGGADGRLELAAAYLNLTLLVWHNLRIKSAPEVYSILIACTFL